MTRVKLLLTAFVLCAASETMVHAQATPTTPPAGTTSTGPGTMTPKHPAGAPHQAPKGPAGPKAPGGTKPPAQPGGGMHHHHFGLHHHHHMHHIGGGMGSPKTPMKK